jgi:ribonuclease HI
MKKIEIYFDGASRNNPGPAGAGGVIKENGQTIRKYHRYLGRKTNNEAEYLAVLLGVKIVRKLELRPDQLILAGDSSLIIQQLAGRYKIKNERLKKLHGQVRREIINIGCGVDFKDLPREKNKEADKLANKGIDEAKVKK